MKFDGKQKEAIDCRANVVVAAGAGAGKTSVLTERYLSLLKEQNVGVDNILALTFTRKAAAEMYERIYRKLSESDDPDLLRHLENFEDAAVTTLDSFCRSICLNAINSYGLPRDFQLDDKLFREHAEQEALDFFTDFRSSHVFREFAASAGFERVWKELLVDLACNSFRLPAKRDIGGELEVQLKELSGRLKSHLADLRQSLDAVLSCESDLDSVEKRRADARKIGAALHESASPSEIADYLADKSLKFNKNFGASKKPEIIELKEVLDAANARLDAIYETAEVLAASDRYRQMHELLAVWQDRVFNLKRKTAILTFSDLVSISIDILTRDLELRRYYKQKYRYIMIDEFQDNNRRQKDLLYLLAEEDGTCDPGIPESSRLHPSKLFFVGDEKQSIYKFRGADVSVFKELQNEVLAIGGDCLDLKTNYRSEPALINFFNELFPDVMRNEGESYEADFSPLEFRAAAAGVVPVIEFRKKAYLPDGQDDSDRLLGNDEAEAFETASWIRDAVTGKSLMLPGGKSADYGDFAILMKSTSNQQLYEQMLRRFGVPFTTVGTRSLFLDAPANDLYSLLQTVLMPTDRTAAASFLRSPYAALGDDALVTLLASGNPVVLDAENASLLDPAARELFEKALELVRKLKGMIDIRSLADVLDFLWYGQGYRYTILSRPGMHNFTEFHGYLRKIAFTYDSGGKTCSEFLDFLRRNLGNYEKLDEEFDLAQDSRGVQIMTIHKSKGLEFPVVILANCGNRGRGNQARPYYISSDWGLSMNLVGNRRQTEGNKSRYVNPFFREGKSENDARDAAELKRLLYVGCTRAEQHLVISGCENRGNRGEGRTMLNLVDTVLAAKPEAAAMVTFREIPDRERKELFAMSQPAGSRTAAEMLKVYKALSSPEIRIPRRRLKASGIEDKAGVPGDLLGECSALKCESALGSDRLNREFGTLCHNYIENMLQGREQEIPPGIFQFPDEIRTAVGKEAKRLANLFLSSELGTRARNAEIMYPEKEFLYSPDGKTVISGISDLYFSDVQGDVLIDFKSDRKVYGDAYRIQFTIYAYAWKALTGRTPECYLFYLRDGKTVKPDLLSKRELDEKIGRCFYE